MSEFAIGVLASLLASALWVLLRNLSSLPRSLQIRSPFGDIRGKWVSVHVAQNGPAKEQLTIERQFWGRVSGTLLSPWIDDPNSIGTYRFSGFHIAKGLFMATCRPDATNARVFRVLLMHVHPDGINVKGFLLKADMSTYQISSATLELHRTSANFASHPSVQKEGELVFFGKLNNANNFVADLNRQGIPVNTLSQLDEDRLIATYTSSAPLSFEFLGEVARRNGVEMQLFRDSATQQHFQRVVPRKP